MSCLAPLTHWLQNPGVSLRQGGGTPAPTAGMYLGDRPWGSQAVHGQRGSCLRCGRRICTARASEHICPQPLPANQSYHGVFAPVQGPGPWPLPFMLCYCPGKAGMSTEATLQILKLCRTLDLAIWLLATFTARRFYYNTLPSSPHLFVFFFFNSWNCCTPPATCK